MRPDLYEEAMKEIGYTHGGLDNRARDAVRRRAFDPAKPEEYATSFPVHEPERVIAHES